MLGAKQARRGDAGREDDAAVLAGTRSISVQWENVIESLESRGCATIGPLLSPEQCRAIAALYDADARFRSRVVMARHNYGRGEYKYFAYPLPELVVDLRSTLYPPLAAIANRWNEAMAVEIRFPREHAGFLARCHADGQTKPTPLILRYGPDDYNCLHQDLYGEHVFPLQVVTLLSAPGQDFTGGELVITEQRPRMQSRVEVIALGQGDAAVIPVRHRPVRGARGVYRVNVRHGVSRVTSGRRHTLGIIFHDAQ